LALFYLLFLHKRDSLKSHLYIFVILLDCGSFSPPYAGSCVGLLNFVLVRACFGTQAIPHFIGSCIYCSASMRCACNCFVILTKRKKEKVVLKIQRALVTEKNVTAIPGWVVLDRCGRHFALVLNFLRDGSVPLPEDQRELDEVLKEAQYYQVQGLVQHCLSAMQVNC